MDRRLCRLAAFTIILFVLGGCRTETQTGHLTPTRYSRESASTSNVQPELDKSNLETPPPAMPGSPSPKADVSYDIEGKVVTVTDGDTIKVLSGRETVKVRLNGIDAPESHQDFGTQSKRTLSGLVFGKVVGVDVVDTDRYGRKVGVVYTPDGTNVNEAMVYAGMAWWYRQYAPNDSTLAKYEQDARKAKRGLWARPDAVPPWEFRNGGRGNR